MERNVKSEPSCGTRGSHLTLLELYPGLPSGGVSIAQKYPASFHNTLRGEPIPRNHMRSEPAEEGGIQQKSFFCLAMEICHCPKPIILIWDSRTIVVLLNMKSARKPCCGQSIKIFLTFNLNSKVSCFVAEVFQIVLQPDFLIGVSVPPLPNGNSFFSCQAQMNN